MTSVFFIYSTKFWVLFIVLKNEKDTIKDDEIKK